jgi:hypothetical protein
MDIGLSKDMPRCEILILNFDLEFLKGLLSLKALPAKNYRITNGLRGQQVLMFPNSNPNCIYIYCTAHAETTAKFFHRSAVNSSEL